MKILDRYLLIRMILCITLLLSWCCSNSQSKQKLIENIRFVDRSGSHIVNITEFQSGKFFTEDWVSSITVQILGNRNDIDTLLWKFEIAASNAYSVSRYFPKSLLISDANKDGFKEVSFIVDICPDGIDPCRSKLMIYDNGRILYIDGVVPQIENDETQYQVTFSPGLQADELFLKFGKELWNRYYQSIKAEW